MKQVLFIGRKTILEWKNIFQFLYYGSRMVDSFYAVIIIAGINMMDLPPVAQVVFLFIRFIKKTEQFIISKIDNDRLYNNYI